MYVLDRLNILSYDDFDGLELRWHKTCYPNFSSESKLHRLRKQCQTSTSIASTSCPIISSTHKRHSCQAAIDWSLCMFCQAHNNKKVHRVETLDKSADLLGCNPISMLKYWVNPQRVFALVLVAFIHILDDGYECFRYTLLSEWSRETRA